MLFAFQTLIPRQARCCYVRMNSLQHSLFCQQAFQLGEGDVQGHGKGHTFFGEFFFGGYPQLCNFSKCFWPTREHKYFFFQKWLKYGLVLV